MSQKIDKIDTETLHKLLFVPPTSKEMLGHWVELFLGLDLPDCTVDPTSNSNPLDFLWEIYQKMLDGTDPDYMTVLLYSCRDGYKTILCSVLEILCFFVLKRDICHAAAISQQSGITTRYIKEYFARPILKEYLILRNERTIEIGWYENGDSRMTPAQHDAYVKSGNSPWKEVKYQIKILVATEKSFNSAHVPFLVLDELDLIPESSLREARLIPAVGKERGELPVTFYTSTRKFSFGNVQKMIDNASDTGLKIYHWNIMDLTQKCPEKRHLPMLPKIPIYVNDKTLSAISEDEYNSLNSDKKKDFEKHEGFQGCLSNCKIFSACFTPDTYIMMADGTQKQIDKILVGDEVITHTGSIKKVLNTFSRFTNEDIFEVQHPSWSKKTYVTKEHPYFINGEEFNNIEFLNKSYLAYNKDIRANKLYASDYLSLPINYKESHNKKINYIECVHDRDLYVFNGLVRAGNRTKFDNALPNSITLDNLWGWVIGFFCAEGSFKKHKRGGRKSRNSLIFSTHVNETDYHKKIEFFARSIGLECKGKRRTNRSMSFEQQIHSSTLSELFASLCGEYCDKKKLLPQLLNFDRSFLASILDGFWCGDGSKHTKMKSRKHLISTSYDLISQLFLIAARLGLCPRISFNRPLPGKKQSYSLFYNNLEVKPKNKLSNFAIKNNYNLYRLDIKNVVSYSGLVYNFEVDGDNSYIANGIAVHNCKTRLATEQKSNSKLLKNINLVQGQFKSNPIDIIQAQYLCWKPSQEGLVYPYLDRDLHMISAAEMARKITGEDHPENMSKSELVKLMMDVPVEFYAGIDHGFTHYFSVCLMAVHGPVGYVISCYEAADLELFQQIELLDSTIKPFNPIIYADPEGAQNNATLKRIGYDLRKWNKGPGSVMDGIFAVRAKLKPVVGPPQLYFLKDDPGVDSLFKKTSQYHWKLDGNERPTDQPDKKHDDNVDALRYAVMNVFKQRTGVVLGDNTTPYQNQVLIAANNNQNWVQNIIREKTGGIPPEDEPDNGKTKETKKRGFYWDI